MVKTSGISNSLNNEILAVVSLDFYIPNLLYSNEKLGLSLLRRKGNNQHAEGLF
jgi:hypothetical protein